MNCLVSGATNLMLYHNVPPTLNLSVNKSVHLRKQPCYFSLLLQVFELFYGGGTLEGLALCIMANHKHNILLHFYYCIFLLCNVWELGTLGY